MYKDKSNFDHSHVIFYTKANFWVLSRFTVPREDLKYKIKCSGLGPIFSRRAYYCKNGPKMVAIVPN